MRWIGFAVLGAALTGLGCMPMTVAHDDPAAKVKIQPPPAPPIVMPDSVNEKNAWERARALREEEENEASRTGAPVGGGK
jgi:hypothetical protein